MKFLMYGAGSIGRGFIGPLFANAGYEVVFVDISEPIINALNSQNSYRYTIATKAPYDITVSNVRGIDGRDEKSVIEEIAGCDLMAVSLGSNVLEKVAPLIAKGFSLRMEQGGLPLNILICENLKNAASILRDWLINTLPHEQKSLLNKKCGLIETAIGRMVPVAELDPNDPLHVTVEEYDFLPVDKDAFIGEPPSVEGLIPYSPFSFYEERKLYLHNMGHAICAYLGLQQGYQTIDQAIGNPFIRLLTQSAMIESAAMLSAKYKIPFNQIFDHAEDLLQRFGNSALGDTCERVGRDPMRKLGSDDRLAGVLRQCHKYDVYPVYISLGYAAALRHVTCDPEQAAKLTLETGQLSGEQSIPVMKLFNALSLSAEEILETAEALKKDLRGSVV